MELKTGKISFKELSEWFGISYGGFRNSKDKFLKRLEVFAKYEIVKGGVNILEVYVSKYDKALVSNYSKIKNKIDETWDESGLDTCSRVSEEIYDELGGDKAPIKESTVYEYTRAGRNELYGKPYTTVGTLGTCKYMWCKKVDGGYVPLTKEEEAIKQKLYVKYFGDVTEKQLFVFDMVDNGEITKDEAVEILRSITGMKGGNFMDFLREFKGAINCEVVRGTFVNRFEKREFFLEN